MSQTAARVLISGRVQGVYFRAHTRDAAEKLGLRGWVRNLPGGRVEAWFQGPKETVEKAIAWCHEGSPYSRVDQVAVDWQEPQALANGFDIRY